jgi:hypothetical protein
MGPRQLKPATVCLSLSVQSAALSKSLALSLSPPRVCVSLSSLSGQISKLSQFFVIKLTKQEIVLKLRWKES